MKITLYKKDNLNSIRIWEAEAEYDCESFIIRHGMMGGAIQTKWVNVALNQSGRNIYQQVDLELTSAANKKIDAGYCRSMDEAVKNFALNAMKLHRPMLAQPLKANTKFSKQAMIQNKYDGNRCLIYNAGDRLVAYSRNGKEISTIDHILRNLDFPVGVTLDGELYCHGVPLQTIMSWTKRYQDNTNRLDYIAFDVIDKRPFTDRFYMLDHWGIPNVAPTFKLGGIPLMDHFHLAKDNGFEGLIVRDGSAGYEAGKRSKSLIKVKSCEDGWFQITNVVPSKDGWGIFECVATNGKPFSVNSVGGIAERKHYLEYKDKYIGKRVRIEYANLTPDGIPFHPVAVALEP